MNNFMPPFLLIRQDGWVVEFDDLATLACAVRNQITVSQYHVDSITLAYGNLTPHCHEWIVRDNLGQIVTHGDILAAAPYRSRLGTYHEQRRKAVLHAAALGLPIPRTGRRHPHCYYLRHPQTFGTNRAHCAAKQDTRNGDLPTKGKIKLLPTYFDDRLKMNCNDRCWKRFRRNQSRNRHPS